MATVPYQPVPTVTPEVAPTRPLHINTNGAMFGENIGSALDSLGHDVSGVGNELYQTAINFRKLDIENEVNEAVTKNDIESGNLQNAFKLTEGKDPQEQLTSHTQQLDTTRKSIRDTLTSDYAKQQYDRQTMRQFGYNVINAGGYAASQSKQYDKQVRKTAMDNAIDQIAKDPNNEQFVNDQLAKVAELATRDSMDAGETDDVRKDTIQKNLAVAVDKVAKTIKNPEQAIAFVNRAKGYIHDVAFQQILSTVEDRAVGTRATRDAAQIADPLAPLLERARAVTKQQESGGDYGNVTTTVSQRTGQPQSALGAYGVMDFQLAEWTKKAIGREVSRDEFLRSPEIQDKVYDTYMGDYIRRFGVEGAGRAWIGGEGAVKGDPNIKDPLGTSRGAYGAKFAAQVGVYNPKDSIAKSYVDMDQAIVEKAGQLYANDPERRQRYIQLGQAALRQNTKIQQQEVDQKETQLKGDINTVLRAQGQNGFAPRSIEEAMKLDPNFETKMDEVKKYDKTYEDKVKKTFAANATAETPWTPEKQNLYYKTQGMPNEQLEKFNEDDEYAAGHIMRADMLKIKDRKAKYHLASQTELHVDAMLQRNQSLLDAIKAHPSRSEDIVDDEGQTANQRYIALRGRAIAAMDEHIQRTGAPMDSRTQEDLMKSLTKEVVSGVHDHWMGIPLPSFLQSQVKEYEFERQEKAVKAEEAAKPKAVRAITVRQGPDGKTYWMGSDNQVHSGPVPSE